MKARLAYLCSSESWGGLEMNHLRNAQWMQERGHSVLFICVKGSPIDRNANEMKLPTAYIEKHKKYYDFANGKKLVQLLKDEDITHLLIRSTYDMSILAYAKRKLKDALHTSYFMEMQLGVKKTNPLHTFRFGYIDAWSCPLHWLEKQVREMTRFRNKLVVIPSGLELAKFSDLSSKEASRTTLGLKTGAFTFGLIGRFDQQKGQLLLLEAMTKTKHNDYHVALLGEPTLNEGDAYYDEMKNTIDRSNLAERVHLFPFRKDAETFYNAVDWLVMATKAETFGMVTVEALATGTPVLGSNAGGTPEILDNGRGGKLFTTLDSTDLALKIDEVLDSHQQPNKEELISMASDYDHHSVCDSVEQLLGIKAK